MGYNQVGSIPPYGEWSPINALTYANGLLILPYNNAASDR
jgi:hypothetical protein